MAVLLVDTVRSTHVCATIGQDRFDFLMAEQYAALRRIVQRAGGAGAHSAGDGLLAWFPSAATALETAQRMHDEVAAIAERAGVDDLAVRVVVTLSDVRVIDGEMRGVAPLIAARLEKTVGPGETVCTEAVRAAALGRGGSSFRRLGTRDLPGVPEPVVVWQVGGGPLAAAPPAPWRPLGTEIDELWDRDGDR